ncbi:MAG: hypothetical protein AAFW47_03290 [Pseudomonadota bacterium]
MPGPQRTSEAASDDEKEMADLLGADPDLLDDVFKDLGDWEAILRSLPDLPEDSSE